MSIGCEWRCWQEHSPATVPVGGRQSGDFVNRTGNIKKMKRFLKFSAHFQINERAITARFTKPPASWLPGFAWYNSCGTEMYPLGCE